MISPWISIVATYGMEFAVELAKLLKDKPEPTPEDFLALKEKYASKTAADYLAAPGPFPPV